MFEHLFLDNQVIFIGRRNKISKFKLSAPYQVIYIF